MGAADAPLVVLWHALGPFQSGAYGGEVAAGLADEYGLRVIAPDGPGFGESPALPADAYRPSALADLAAKLIPAESCDWIGASWGGTVGCWFAERYRERLRRLVLLDVGYQAPLERLSLEEWIEERRSLEELAWSNWDEVFSDIDGTRPGLAEAVRASLQPDRDGSLRPILTPEVAGAVLRGVAEEPPGPHQLAGVPVLLLTAADADEEAVARFRAAAPHVETRPVPGTGHDLLGDAGPELVPIIGDWLTRP